MTENKNGKAPQQQATANDELFEASTDLRKQFTYDNSSIYEQAYNSVVLDGCSQQLELRSDSAKHLKIIIKKNSLKKGAEKRKSANQDLLLKNNLRHSQKRASDNDSYGLKDENSPTILSENITAHQHQINRQPIQCDYINATITEQMSLSESRESLIDRHEP